MGKKKKKKERSGSLWLLLRASVAAEQSLTVDVTHARCPIHTPTEPPPLEGTALIPVSTAHKQLGRPDCFAGWADEQQQPPSLLSQQRD